MPIPKEILEVERPKNTVVCVYGKEKNKYAVRKRIGCKRVNGRNVPINGPTIGHIVNGKYISLESQIESVHTSEFDLKDWAKIELCDKEFSFIQQELLKFYNTKDMLKIYCISLLRVAYHGIKNYQLEDAYNSSFLSEKYPGVSLSKNTVSTFIEDLGKTYSRINSFMKNRVSSIGDDEHLLIDGTLKTNESRINSLSDFSRKARIKGTKDISIIYAFNLEKMEPICSKTYPGNMLDATAYSDFISTNSIKKGIIVADKGFPSNCAKSWFEKNKDLHYLNPIKRNSKLIERHNMLDFDTILNGYEGITCKKEKVNGVNKYLYSFKDLQCAINEEMGYLNKSKKQNNFDKDDHNKKSKNFGTIVLECDLDLEPEVVYKAYSSRWEIELVMRYYKQSCEFNETRVHTDYSLYGDEFINFLSSLLTFKILNKLEETKLLDKMTYKNIMHQLDKAKKIKFKDENWQFVKLNPSVIKILEDLNLVEPSVPKTEKRTRGRPKKSIV